MKPLWSGSSCDGEFFTPQRETDENGRRYLASGGYQVCNYAPTHYLAISLWEYSVKEHEWERVDLGEITGVYFTATVNLADACVDFNNHHFVEKAYGKINGVAMNPYPEDMDFYADCSVSLS